MSVSVLAVSKQKNKTHQSFSLPMATLQERWKQIRELELEKNISPLRVSTLSSYREKSYSL